MPRPLTRPISAPVLGAVLAGILSLPLPGLSSPARAEDAGAYLAARVAGSNSDYREAASWFTRALIADPQNPALMEGAIIANLSLGDFSPAIAVAERLEQMGGQGEALYLTRLADQAKRGAWTDLLDEIRGRQRIGPLVDQLTTAWAELGAGRMSEALEGFDKVAATKGLEAFGLYHKALALASVGDFEGADEILSGRAKGELRMMRRGIVAHAQVLSQLERNADAIALLDRTFGADMEQDPGVSALRARLEAGEVVPFDVARTATDGVAEVFFTVATALSREAESGYTLIYTRVAAYLRPDHDEAVLMTADLLNQSGQPELAVETFAQIARDNPAFHAAEIGRATALYASGRKDAAIEALQSLARNQPDLIIAHVALADALRREERWPESIAAYDAAIDRLGTPERQHWMLFYSRGIANERAKRWPAAEADFRKALELEPNQPEVLNYLGYSYLELGENLDEALSMIERAVAARPESGHILDSLAWGKFRLGRYAEAVTPMEQASLLEPVDPIVTDHLGDVYWAVGRTLEARFQWRRALSFDPEEKEAVRIRKKLEIGLDAVLKEEGAKPIAVDVSAGAAP